MCSDRDVKGEEVVRWAQTWLKWRLNVVFLPGVAQALPLRALAAFGPTMHRLRRPLPLLFLNQE